jgi:hypothetical protein
LVPIFVGISLLFLGRSFYALYVIKNGTRVTEVITWLSLTFVIGFWTWQLFLS